MQNISSRHDSRNEPQQQRSVYKRLFQRQQRNDFDRFEGSPDFDNREILRNQGRSQYQTERKKSDIYRMAESDRDSESVNLSLPLDRSRIATSNKPARATSSFIVQPAAKYVQDTFVEDAYNQGHKSACHPLTLVPMNQQDGGTLLRGRTMVRTNNTALNESQREGGRKSDEIGGFWGQFLVQNSLQCFEQEFADAGDVQQALAAQCSRSNQIRGNQLAIHPRQAHSSLDQGLMTGQDHRKKGEAPSQNINLAKVLQMKWKNDESNEGFMVHQPNTQPHKKNNRIPFVQKMMRPATNSLALVVAENGTTCGHSMDSSLTRNLSERPRDTYFRRDNSQSLLQRRVGKKRDGKELESLNGNLLDFLDKETTSLYCIDSGGEVVYDGNGNDEINNETQGSQMKMLIQNQRKRNQVYQKLRRLARLKSSNSFFSEKANRAADRRIKIKGREDSQDDQNFNDGADNSYSISIVTEPGKHTKYIEEQKKQKQNNLIAARNRKVFVPRLDLNDPLKHKSLDERAYNAQTVIQSALESSESLEKQSCLKSTKMGRKSNDSRSSKFKCLSINVKQANATGNCSTDGINHFNTNSLGTGTGTNANTNKNKHNTPPVPQNDRISPGYIDQTAIVRKSENLTGQVYPVLQACHNPHRTTTQQLQTQAMTAVETTNHTHAFQNLQKNSQVQEAAISPFNKSQISQSDFSQFQTYFDLDNKDCYFRDQQIHYYTHEYPNTLEEKKRQVPITKWQLGKMIGHGSFGDVYEGIDQKLGRQIAVKQVQINKIANNTGSQQKKIRALKQEISLLSSLQHKNIVKFLGTHEDGENLYVFLEYVAQGSLEHHYKNYKFTENLVASYTQQILLGLEYLHYNNIVHRDIKAANILLRDNGTCQLADFGSSKKIIEKTNANTKSFCGTPYWMAPEVVKQSGHNRFADIWSLGCTVYEMIAKEPPWMDKKENQVFKVFNKIATATKPPKYPNRISPALKDFLDCCFQYQANMRANVYELLRHPFITREEFKTPLAHVKRLQPINEQISQISDASPFTTSQRNFFQRLERTQNNANLQASMSPNLHPPDRSPYIHPPDASPFSHFSSKTQGNLPHQRGQRLFQFGGDGRSLAPMNRGQQQSNSSSAPTSKQSSEVLSHALSQKTPPQLFVESNRTLRSSEESKGGPIEQTSSVRLSRTTPMLQTIQEASERVVRAEEEQLRQETSQQLLNLAKKVTPESGSSEHEHDESAKQSLNVDSAGGNAKQYSLAQLMEASQEDVSSNGRSSEQDEELKQESDSPTRQARALTVVRDSEETQISALASNQRQELLATNVAAHSVQPNLAFESIHVDDDDQLDLLGPSPIEPMQHLKRLKTTNFDSKSASPEAKRELTNEYRSQSSIKDSASGFSTMTVKTGSFGLVQPAEEAKEKLSRAAQSMGRGSQNERRMREFAARFQISRGNFQMKDDSSENSQDGVSSGQYYERRSSLKQISDLEIKQIENVSRQGSKKVRDSDLTDIEEEEVEAFTGRIGEINSPTDLSQQIEKKASEQQQPNLCKEGGETSDSGSSSDHSTVILQSVVTPRIREEQPIQVYRGTKSFSDARELSVLSPKSPVGTQRATETMRDKPSAITPPGESATKRKQVEDEIFNQIAKAQMNALQAQQQNGRMIKKRGGFTVPKIFVLNSNKLEPAHNGQASQESISSLAGSSLIVSSSHTFSGQLNSMHAPSSKQPQNTYSQSNHEDFDGNSFDSATKAKQLETEQLVLQAITDQLTKKKLLANIQVHEEDRSLEESKSQSEGSSSYQSPEIDSDELAALGDDNLV